MVSDVIDSESLLLVNDVIVSLLLVSDVIYRVFHDFRA